MLIVRFVVLLGDLGKGSINQITFRIECYYKELVILLSNVQKKSQQMTIVVEVQAFATGERDWIQHHWNKTGQFLNAGAVRQEIGQGDEVNHVC